MTEKFYDKFTQKKSTKKKSPSKADRTEGKITKKPVEVKVVPEKKVFSPDAKVLLKKPLFQSSQVPADAKKLIENFDQIIQNIKPLNSRQMQQLPENIRNLSHQMTDQRSARRLGYMNENIQLSAYVRYFTWWNLVRLTKLFSNFPSECFPCGDEICMDLGSGPLTVVTALWLSRPELRQKNLTWYCLDVSQNSLSLGEEIYLSVAARIPGNTWKIIRVKGSFGTFIKEKPTFITCANMFNELDQASDMPPEYQTKKYYDQLRAYGKSETKYLLIEPGVPKATRTLSLLRERFIKDEYRIPSPCPHYLECPMNGFKAYTGSTNKWCNFAFSTEDAPQKLQKLSTSAKLPKERAVLSFITAVPGVEDKRENQKEKKLCIRIASDSFRLPGNFTGHYACSSLGLTMVASRIENLESGDYLELELTKPGEELSLDAKSGAKKLLL